MALTIICKRGCQKTGILQNNKIMGLQNFSLCLQFPGINFLNPTEFGCPEHAFSALPLESEEEKHIDLDCEV